MTQAALTRAFLFLLGLSVGTTLLAELRPQAGVGFVALVLILAGFKARVILMDYLDLRRAPKWQRGFNAFLVVFLLTGFGLYLAG